MGQQSTSGRLARCAVRAVSSMSFAVALFWLIAPAMATVSEFHCHGAIMDFGKTGDERLEHFDDGHGHDVELWCVRDVFAAHFDLRIGWNDPTAPGGHRSRSIAGCFFNEGRNEGPDFTRDATGAFGKIEWINKSPPSENARYRFIYDYRSNLVTITMTDSCHPPVSTTIAPQENIERLEALLPAQKSGFCPSTAPMDNPASGG